MQRTDSFSRRFKGEAELTAAPAYPRSRSTGQSNSYRPAEGDYNSYSNYEPDAGGDNFDFEETTWSPALTSGGEIARDRPTRNNHRRTLSVSSALRPQIYQTFHDTGENQGVGGAVLGLYGELGSAEGELLRQRSEQANRIPGSSSTPSTYGHRARSSLAASLDGTGSSSMGSGMGSGIGSGIGGMGGGIGSSVVDSEALFAAMRGRHLGAGSASMDVERLADAAGRDLGGRYDSVGGGRYGGSMRLGGGDGAAELRRVLSHRESDFANGHTGRQDGWPDLSSDPASFSASSWRGGGDSFADLVGKPGGGSSALDFIDGGMGMGAGAGGGRRMGAEELLGLAGELRQGRGGGFGGAGAGMLGFADEDLGGVGGGGGGGGGGLVGGAGAGMSVGGGAGVQLKAVLKLVEAAHANDVALLNSVLQEASSRTALLNALHPATGRTALHEAVVAGSLDAAALLLEWGADPDGGTAAAEGGQSPPLMSAVQAGSEEAVRLLLTNGADINATDARLCSALHYACATGHRSIIKLLLVAGANMYARNRDGLLPQELTSSDRIGALFRKLHDYHQRCAAPDSASPAAAPLDAATRAGGLGGFRQSTSFEEGDLLSGDLGGSGLLGGSGGGLEDIGGFRPELGRSISSSSGGTSTAARPPARVRKSVSFALPSAGDDGSPNQHGRQRGESEGESDGGSGKEETESGSEGGGVRRHRRYGDRRMSPRPPVSPRRRAAVAAAAAAGGIAGHGKAGAGGDKEGEERGDAAGRGKAASGGGSPSSPSSPATSSPSAPSPSASPPNQSSPLASPATPSPRSPSTPSASPLGGKADGSGEGREEKGAEKQAKGGEKGGGGDLKSGKDVMGEEGKKQEGEAGHGKGGKGEGRAEGGSAGSGSEGNESDGKSSSPSSSPSATTTSATSTTSSASVAKALAASGSVSMSASPLGTLKWKKGDLLGEGAFGKVFLGLNEMTGELMAVKQIKMTTAGDEKAMLIASLEREIVLYRQMRHRHIVGYIDMEKDEADGSIYIFLELVSGGSLHSMLEKFGKFSESLVRVYTRQLLLGLEYLHGCKIIHRDIKGGNVLVDRDGVIKLADFGASKAFHEGTVGEGCKSIRGSVFWMAPEVIKGEGYGRRADIWSLGCTVIEMLTGSHPWPGMDNTWSAIFHIAKTTTGPPIPEGISDEGREFLEACFHIEPYDRPSATELLKLPFVQTTPCHHSLGTIFASIPDEVSHEALLRLPRHLHCALNTVSKSWSSAVSSEAFFQAREAAGVIEEWLFVLPEDPDQGAFRAFDPNSKSWRAVPPIPGRSKNEGLSEFATVAAGGKMYVIGGCERVTSASPSVMGCADVATARVRVFDPVAWRWDFCAPMGEARISPAAEVLDGRYIVVTGGQGRHAFLRSAEIFDVLTGQWRSISAMHAARCGHRAVVLGGQLTVIAGEVQRPDSSTADVMGLRHDGDGQARESTASIEVYDRQSDRWDLVPHAWIDDCKIPGPMAVLNGDLYAIHQSRLVVRDAATGEWRKCGPIPSLHVSSSGVGNFRRQSSATRGVGMIAFQGKLFLLGGAREARSNGGFGGGRVRLEEVFCWDPAEEDRRGREEDARTPKGLLAAMLVRPSERLLNWEAVGGMGGGKGAILACAVLRV
ncbi:unnamed protein product [Closterium sp. Yama58-4]|nr:unnamed protein product [Closterium sp. Yama58-4]